MCYVHPDPVQTPCFRIASEHVYAAETNETRYFLVDSSVGINRDRKDLVKKTTAGARGMLIDGHMSDSDAVRSRTAPTALQKYI